MKCYLIGIVPVLTALLAGCSADAGQEAGDEDDLTRRPTIELSSQDSTSVAARLNAMLKAFKSDSDLDIASAIESASVKMSGRDSKVSRSVTCTESDMELVGPGGHGFTHRTTTTCTLQGFEKNRAGGSLPNVLVSRNEPLPLANKLVTLLHKGEQKGGFGVKRTGGVAPPCCDRPMSTTYELSDAQGSLVCVNHTGGFAFMVHSECTYTRAIKPNE